MGANGSCCGTLGSLGRKTIDYILRECVRSSARSSACVSELEGGAAAAAFASGSAATRVIFEALSPGDHLVAPEDLYWGIRVMLKEHFAEWGLETTFVDMTDATAVAHAVRANTKLILAETPSNPLIKITDILC